VTNLGKPLTRIDPATNQVTTQFVGIGGDGLRVGLGAVWLCSFGLQQVWRIDASVL
jgi:virginiamycin B lyase